MNSNRPERSLLAGAAEFFELGIPRESILAERIRQIRIIAITSIACCVMGLVSVLQFLRLGLDENALATLVAIGLGVANLILLRATRNPVICGHVAVALFALIVNIDSAATGGYYAPNFSSRRGRR